MSNPGKLADFCKLKKCQWRTGLVINFPGTFYELSMDIAMYHFLSFCSHYTQNIAMYWWKRIGLHEAIVGFKVIGIQSKFSEWQQKVNIFPKYDRLSINLFFNIKSSDTNRLTIGTLCKGFPLFLTDQIPDFF